MKAWSSTPTSPGERSLSHVLRPLPPTSAAVLLEPLRDPVPRPRSPAAASPSAIAASAATRASGRRAPAGEEAARRDGTAAWQDEPDGHAPGPQPPAPPHRGHGDLPRRGAVRDGRALRGVRHRPVGARRALVPAQDLRRRDPADPQLAGLHHRHALRPRRGRARPTRSSSPPGGRPQLGRRRRRPALLDAPARDAPTAGGRPDPVGLLGRVRAGRRRAARRPPGHDPLDARRGAGRPLPARSTSIPTSSTSTRATS